MYKQKTNINIFNYLKFGALIILSVLTMFLFFRWLYSTDIVSDGGIDKKLALKKYSDNFYVHIINNTLTAAKTGNEDSYGAKMPGLTASVFSKLTDGMNTDINNPITYFNFVFTAFSQALPTDTVAQSKQPDVKNFEEAPEGAIYFSEEDEYTAEKAAQEEVQQTPEAEAEKNVDDPDKVALAKKSPQILIYHTHASESYMPNTALNYHIFNEKQNVISVGGKMTQILEDKYKYSVIHDKTYNDKESYAYSYRNSLLNIKKQTNKYDSIKVILDIHRDAFDVRGKGEKEKAASKKECTIKINGKNAARVTLVIGTDNPNYKELEKYAVYIKKKMDKLYPGLFMKIVRAKSRKYNEYFSDYSMLIEVGCMLNTDEEAQYSGELMGNVIGEVMKDLEK